MIKGLYSAASAMLAGMNRQETLAHDIANLDTPGFKQVLLSLEDFTATPVVTESGRFPFNQLDQIGEIGLGVMTSSEVTDYAQGALNATDSLLDFAIEGPGFFRIQVEDGEERYTRDGRFNVDSENNLVTVDGYQVLNDSGSPIQLEAGQVEVSRDGTIYIDGEEADQIGIASFENPAEALTRDGGNYFKADGEPDGEETGMIRQGYLEASNADPAVLMTQLVEVLRTYQAAQQMVQNQDELLGRAINTLGRIG